MELRLIWLLCVLAALGSVTSENDPPPPKVRIEKSVLVCDHGTFDKEPKPLTVSDTYSCCSDNTNPDTCSNAIVKILSEENLIQLDMSAVITVLVSDVLVTALIGWAVYIVCAQPSTRASYQDSKASDRKNLIPNERAADGASGDMYQRLNTRTDEYSTLHAQRKPKNNKYP